MTIAPTRQAIAAAVQRHLPGLPFGALHYAHGLVRPDAACMIKRGEYFRIVLSGVYRISYGAGDERHDRRLTAGEMLFNADGSWHREHHDEAYVVFTATEEEDSAHYHIKWREAGAAAMSACRTKPLSRLGRDLFAACRAALEADAGQVAAPLGRALAEQLARELTTSTPVQRTRSQRTWEMICAHIREQDLRLVDRDQLAAACGLHPAHISRLAKQHTGMSLSVYLRGVRLRHAAELLRATTLRVYEIAAACGYGDPVYFGKVFRQAYGCPPGVYRTRSSPGRPDSGQPSPRMAPA